MKRRDFSLGTAAALAATGLALPAHAQKKPEEDRVRWPRRRDERTAPPRKLNHHPGQDGPRHGQRGVRVAGLARP